MTPGAPELNPQLETIAEDPGNFRLVLISSNMKEMGKEVEHYREVAKRYKFKSEDDHTQYFSRHLQEISLVFLIKRRLFS